MADLHSETTRSGRLERSIHDLLAATSEIEAAAVVSFDGLPMAATLPGGMDEDRVAAMSAALLSLGERATVGLGRGDLAQVFIEGEHGTVFLISCDDLAVLVAVAAKGAKTGMMLYEVKRAAAKVAEILRAPDAPATMPAVTAVPAAAKGEPSALEQLAGMAVTPEPEWNGASLASTTSTPETAGTSWS